jgi:signal transduction histidine kinase
MVIVVSEEMETQVRAVVGTILRAPFTRRTWRELWYFVVGGGLAGLAFVFLAATMAAGVVTAITFFGLALLGLGLRGARGIAGQQRRLARALLGVEIDEPQPFVARPGFLGWLQTVLRDRTAWRSVAYIALKVPLTFIGVLTAFSVWFDAAGCLLFPFEGVDQPHVYGLVPAFFSPGYLSIAQPGWIHGTAIFLTGVILFFAAPWGMRVVIAIDRRLMGLLLGPDAVAARMRSLEDARAQTVDASAATLRRIERDLHDGTQAQLVALAMQLGMAKEKLAGTDHPDLDQVRALVNAAHRGAKEAIVELRDLARGIHPPALDVGLEGALSTLAARSPVPTDVTLFLTERPTPAIEAIAYFCVAELLANVAQHATASRASVMCTQSGPWLRVVVRDDGVGGASVVRVGSSSSGLAGLSDRVRAVDGRFGIVSPPYGPTVVTVDLPLHA